MYKNVRKDITEYYKKTQGLMRNMLQKDLENGNKAFLREIYDELSLNDNKRIVEMCGKYPKECRKVEDFVYENIIGI